MTEAAPGLHADIEVTRAHFRLRLTLKAAPGQVIALLGPNGAGKSTVLRTLAGLDRPDRGLVEIDGETWEDTSAGVRVPVEQRLLGMVFQDYLLFPHLSALDNIAFGVRAAGVRRTAARQQARSWLHRMELAEHADAKPRALSGGQAQRAHLAMTFAQGTDWLLLDEPLNNLDMAHSRALMARLADLVRGSGRSVVTVVHEVNYAAAWADHVVAMKNGRVVAQGPAEAVLTEPVLSALYDTPVEVARHDDRPLVLHHHWHDQLGTPFPEAPDAARPTVH